jgi:hypothetical protein
MALLGLRLRQHVQKDRAIYDSAQQECKSREYETPSMPELLHGHDLESGKEAYSR